MLRQKAGRIIENYGISKQQWLEAFLELPNGIPNDDTFRRVFERLNPEALEQSLAQWLQHLVGSTQTRNYSHRWQKFKGFL